MFNKHVWLGSELERAVGTHERPLLRATTNESENGLSEIMFVCLVLRHLGWNGGMFCKAPNISEINS